MVSSVADLRIALSDAFCCLIRLSLAGSPYKLQEELLLDHDVIVEGEPPLSPGGPRVELVGRVALVAGQLRTLVVRQPESALHAATSQSMATIEMRPRAGIVGRAAVLHDVWVNEASASAPPPLAAAAPPPLALRVLAGAKGNTASFCRLFGGVHVGERASPLLQSNVIHGAEGPGIELRGAALSCEVRDNTVRANGGPGILFVARAKAACADNRISGGAGAGIEVTTGAAPLVVRNRVEACGGTGLLVRDGGRGDFRENLVVGAWASAAELCGEGTNCTLRSNRLLECRSGVGVLIHDGAAGVLASNEISGHLLAGLEVGARSAPEVTQNTITRNGGCGILLAADAGGRFKANTVADNRGHGVECCSDADGLLLEGNTISGHAKGAGIAVRSGGRGSYVGNTITANGVGVEVGGGLAELRRNKIHANLREGLHGARAASSDSDSPALNAPTRPH